MSIFFNEITALYAAFLLAQTAVLIFGDDAVPINQPLQISMVMAVCGLLVLLVSMNHFLPSKLLICIGIGVSYSFVLSGMQKVITSKLRVSGFIHYAGWSQAIGRFVSCVVIILLGFAMRHGFSAGILLGISGVLGIFGAMILYAMSVCDGKKY